MAALAIVPQVPTSPQTCSRCAGKLDPDQVVYEARQFAPGRAWLATLHCAVCGRLDGGRDGGATLGVVGYTAMAACSSVDSPPVDYHEYLRSPQWRARRREALWAADYACAACGSVGRLDVHHVSYDRLGQELPEDLQVLCRECHDLAHEELAVARAIVGWAARVEGWWKKVGGEAWEHTVYEPRVELAFIAWLDRRGEGESVPVWVRREVGSG